MTWIFIPLLLAAGTADAQRGVGGMGGGRGGMGGAPGGGRRAGGAGGGGAREARMNFPSAKAIEKFNPAALVLDKHKKLKLAEAQVTQLKGLKQRIFERNATVMGRYDSLQRDFRPPRANPRNRDGDPAADSTLRRAMTAMRQLRLLGDSLLERRRTDVREVLELFPDEAQRKKAAAYLDAQDIKFSAEFPAPPTPREGRRTNTRPGSAPPPR